MAVGKRLRFEILRRDGYRCRYCGASAPAVKLEVDHVVAGTLEGADDPKNLVTSCVDCNSGKASTTVDAAFVAEVDASAQMWTRAMEAAADLHRQNRKGHDAEFDALAAAWTRWTYVQDETPVPLPDDWRTSVESFLAAGLPLDEMIRLVPVAMNGKVRGRMPFAEWRYFCGCCKRVLNELSATARDLIAARDVAQAPVIRTAIDEATVEPTLDDLP